MIKRTLTIAGSDSSGGAGIQADLKTFQEFGTFGFSVLTSLVTMDPEQNWHHEVHPVDSQLVYKQLKTAFAGDAFDAMKTGMLGTVEAIELTSDFIEQYQLEQVVIDPVIACKGTTTLLQPENVAAMIDLLLPKAMITTPNLVEATILAKMDAIETIDDMKEAAEKIYQLGPKHVVVKGGHRLNHPEAVDVFFDGKEFTELHNPLYQTDYNHGAGCTFAAAITAGLAKGKTPLEAVQLAKDFVASGVKNGVKINPWLGHVWHGAYNHAEERLN